MDKIRIGVAGATERLAQNISALTSIDAADVTAVMATSMEKASRSADQPVSSSGLMIMTPCSQAGKLMLSF